MEDLQYVGIYLTIATAFAIVLYIGRSIYYARKNTDIPKAIGEYSIKFHYFVWFFVIPLYVSNLLHDYILISDILNYFPLNLIPISEFVCAILLIVSFIGFFKYTKYSWYSIEAFNIFNVVLHIIVWFINAYYGGEELNIGSVLGTLVSRLAIFVYYYKRKSIFNYRIKRRNKNQEKSNIGQVSANDNDVHFSEPKIETILYCRNCGEKLVDGTKFCRKCGTRIYED